MSVFVSFYLCLHVCIGDVEIGHQPPSRTPAVDNIHLRLRTISLCKDIHLRPSMPFLCKQTPGAAVLSSILYRGEALSSDPLLEEKTQFPSGCIERK